MLPLLDLHQLGGQHFHRHLTVLMLAALHLAGHHDSRGDMGQSDRRGGLVHLLPAGAAGPVHIHFDILRRDFHLYILIDFRHNLQ